ncbi:MAG: cysteine-rich KTR domain-containing protein [Anaerostipes hadrus]
MAEQQIWVLCPVCNNKTRTKIRKDTELVNFPLFCPKCKKENLSDNKKRNYNHYQRARRLDAEPIIYKLYSL